MRKTFFSGLAILLPIIITFFIFVFVIHFFTDPFAGFLDHLLFSYGGEIVRKYHELFLILGRFLVLMLFLLFILIAGMLSHRLFFSLLLKLTDRLFARVPLVKNIYRTFQNVSKHLFTGGKKKLFTQIAFVPFPHGKAYALGLVPGDLPKQIQEHQDERIQSAHFLPVFVPTSPHPLSGFLLMYPKQASKKVDMDKEDLFRWLLSCGAIQTDRIHKKAK